MEFTTFMQHSVLLAAVFLSAVGLAALKRFLLRYSSVLSYRSRG